MKEKMEKSWFNKLIYCMKCSFFLRSAAAADPEGRTTENAGRDGKRKLGGWKCVPYIIGNEAFERVASLGLQANFTVYVVNKLHMEKIAAAQLSNIYGGTSSFAPLVGAFVSDAYWGRFWTLACGSIATFLGMGVFTLTTIIPQLQPPACTSAEDQASACPGASKGQFDVLILSLVLLTIGAGGVRPCSLPFGVDQFDRTTKEGRRSLDSFFNWYYFFSTAATFIAVTVVVYIQDKIGWSLGFGIPTILMLIAIICLFLGMRMYKYVPPEGSVFSGIAQVFVAAFKKRTLQLPAPDNTVQQESLLYAPFCRSARVTKLPLTLQFRCLNKAAIACDGELNEDGSVAKPWRLCSVQQIEEVKCLLRILPVWASGIIFFLALAQIWTFAVLQTLTMDRHLGRHFQVPAGSLGTIVLLTVILFIPLYDRIIVPIARKFTRIESGITLLQRQGVGIFISAMSMVVAGLIEQKRRKSALAHGGMTPMSAFWLSPQLILSGIAEAFNAIGQIEFYNGQFPEHMQTLAGSLLSCNVAAASYLSTILIFIIQKNTSWLDSNDLNHQRIDYFYYVIAGLGAVNVIYFLICAHFYRYKGVPQVEFSNEETEEELKDHHQSV